MSPDEFEKKDPIFAQRNEPRIERPNSENAGVANDSAVDKRSDSGQRSKKNGDSGAGVWKFLVFALVLGLAAIAWFVGQQNIQQKVLTERFDKLSSKINSTDESLNQSGTAISLRLQEQSTELGKHWSEIRKLWGVANDRNRKTLDEHKAQLAKQKSTLKKVEGSVASLKTSMTKLSTTVDTFQGDALAVSTQFEDVSHELQTLRSNIDKIDKQLHSLRNTVATNRVDHEKSMASVDNFRRQTNQQLQVIRDKLAQP